MLCSPTLTRTPARRYAYRQAKDQQQQSLKRQVQEDAESYAEWCGEELTRVLRSREMRCEERWKLCLAVADSRGRTPLMYAASNMGGDDVIKAMLTTGRACLSAYKPEPFDVKYFLNSGDSSTGIKASSRSKHSDAGKGSGKGASDLFSSSLRFVPPPCNTSKFDKLTIAEMTLADDLDGAASRSPDDLLFPRDESFHRKSGQLKMRQKKQRVAAKKAGMGGKLAGKYVRGASEAGAKRAQELAAQCGAKKELAARRGSGFLLGAREAGRNKS